jgi:hypothetical protein
LVDAGLAMCDNLGVRAAARITALRVRCAATRRSGRRECLSGLCGHGRRVWPRFTPQATSATVRW